MEELQGVGGQEVAYVSHQGLIAVVSHQIAQHQDNMIEDALAFGLVVETLHACRTVIPMRYGSLFDDESYIHRHLEEQQSRYTELLSELDGCVEMGIRIQLQEDKPVPDAPLPREPKPKTGLSYLKSRCTHYEAEAKTLKSLNELALRINGELSGLYRRSRLEAVAGGERLPCLYYLVPRSSISTFCNIFHALLSGERHTLLLNGPWPPYNFADDGYNEAENFPEEVSDNNEPQT